MLSLKISAVSKKHTQNPLTEFKNSNGVTLIEHLATTGSLEVIKQLSEYGFLNDNSSKEILNSSLILAAENGHLEIAEMLLNSGANPNFVSRGRDHSLSSAAGMGHLRIVELLIRHNAKLEVESGPGKSALEYAAQYGHADVLKILIASGAKLKYGALIDAVEKGHAEVVRILLDADKSKFLLKTNDSYPLFLAVKKGQVEILKILIKAGYDVNAQQHKNFALIKAADLGLNEIVKVLAENGADLNITDYYTGVSYSPLMTAVGKGRLDTVELLIKLGADVNFQNSYYLVTALHLSLSQNLKITKKLLEAGAHFDLKDREGNTALMDAKKLKNIAAVKLMR